MAFDPKELRNAFGAFPTGVTVVTTVKEDGAPVGFTANSFTSVSLEPPLLLVCPARRLSSFDVFETCSHFAVNVLAEGQEAVSNIFAGFEGDRFAQVAWEQDARGFALITGAAARFCCKTHQVIPAGDHALLIGTVIRFDHKQRHGLGYAAGHYFSIGLEQAAAESSYAGRPSFAGVLVQHQGKVLLCRTAAGYQVPQMSVGRTCSAHKTVEEWVAGQGLAAEIGPTYAVYDGAQGEHFIFFLAKAETDHAPTHSDFVPMDALCECAFTSKAERAMLERLATETQTQSFGFYVGDSVSGYVHTLEKTR